MTRTAVGVAAALAVLISAGIGTGSYYGAPHLAAFHATGGAGPVDPEKMGFSWDDDCTKQPECEFLWYQIHGKEAHFAVEISEFETIRDGHISLMFVDSGTPGSIVSLRFLNENLSKTVYDFTRVLAQEEWVSQNHMGPTSAFVNPRATGEFGLDQLQDMLKNHVWSSSTPITLSGPDHVEISNPINLRSPERPRFPSTDLLADRLETPGDYHYHELRVGQRIWLFKDWIGIRNLADPTLSVTGEPTSRNPLYSIDPSNERIVEVFKEPNIARHLSKNGALPLSALFTFENDWVGLYTENRQTPIKYFISGVPDNLVVYEGGFSADRRDEKSGAANGLQSLFFASKAGQSHVMIRGAEMEARILGPAGTAMDFATNNNTFNLTVGPGVHELQWIGGMDALEGLGLLISRTPQPLALFLSELDYLNGQASIPTAIRGNHTFYSKVTEPPLRVEITKRDLNRDSAIDDATISIYGPQGQLVGQTIIPDDGDTSERGSLGPEQTAIARTPFAEPGIYTISVSGSNDVLLTDFRVNQRHLVAPSVHVIGFNPCCYSGPARDNSLLLFYRGHVDGQVKFQTIHPEGVQTIRTAKSNGSEITPENFTISNPGAVVTMDVERRTATVLLVESQDVVGSADGYFSFSPQSHFFPKTVTQVPYSTDYDRTSREVDVLFYENQREEISATRIGGGLMSVVVPLPDAVVGQSKIVIGLVIDANPYATSGPMLFRAPVLEYYSSPHIQMLGNG